MMDPSFSVGDPHELSAIDQARAAAAVAGGLRGDPEIVEAVLEEAQDDPNPLAVLNLVSALAIDVGQALALEHGSEKAMTVARMSAARFRVEAEAEGLS